MFSEASKRAIKEMGNLELYELGETVRTTQCLACLRHSKEGTVYCGVVGVGCPRQNNQKEAEIELISSLIFCMSSNREYVENAMDTKIGSTITGKPKMPRKKNSKKREYTTIAKRWKEDPSYRETQHVHAWTLEYRTFLTASTQSTSVTRLPDQNELDSTIDTYSGLKATKSLAEVKHHQGQEHAGFY